MYVYLGPAGKFSNFIFIIFHCIRMSKHILKNMLSAENILATFRELQNPSNRTHKGVGIGRDNLLDEAQNV